MYREVLFSHIKFSLLGNINFPHLETFVKMEKGKTTGKRGLSSLSLSRYLCFLLKLFSLNHTDLSIEIIFRQFTQTNSVLTIVTST